MVFYSILDLKYSLRLSSNPDNDFVDILRDKQKATATIAKLILFIEICTRKSIENSHVRLKAGFTWL